MLIKISIENLISSTLSLVSERQISLYTIPLAYLLCIGPHIYAVKRYEYLTSTVSSSTHPSRPLPASEDPQIDSSPAGFIGRKRNGYDFDSKHPRTFLSRVDANPSLSEMEKLRIHRAEAASLNGYENLGFFASAGVAALLAASLPVGLGMSDKVVERQNDIWWANMLSLGYVVSRVGFVLGYVRGIKGVKRGAWFYAGIGCVLGLYVRAARVLGRMER